jgi:hypothetical protein
VVPDAPSQWAIALPVNLERPCAVMFPLKTGRVFLNLAQEAAHSPFMRDTF